MPQVSKREYDHLRTLSTRRGLNSQDLEALAGICNALALDDDLNQRPKSKLDGWVAQVRSILAAMWDGEAYLPSILLSEHLLYMMLVADVGLKMVNDPATERFLPLHLGLGMVPEHVRELHAKLTEMAEQAGAENRKRSRRQRRQRRTVYA